MSTRPNVRTTPVTQNPQTDLLPAISSGIACRSYVPDDLLVSCGFEAVSSSSLSFTEISAVYSGIKSAVSFVSRLKPHHGPADLVQEHRDMRGRRRVRWSKLGYAFIDQLFMARRVSDLLSGLTPGRQIVRDVQEAQLEDESGIPRITVPLVVPYLRAHPCIQALIDASPSFEEVFSGCQNSRHSVPDDSRHKWLADSFSSFAKPENLQALKKASDNSRRNCNKAYNSLRRYLKGLLVIYRRVLVVRLDLYYRQPYAQDSRVCNHRRISADRVKFLDLIRSNYPAFVGYAWKLEVGVQRHWHAHMLLCFDGDCVCRDMVIGYRLGEAWLKLTNGQGDYFNCNGKRHQYRHDAIGMVHAGKPEEVSLLMGYPVIYLTKIDYYASLELPDGGRSFGKGQLPRAGSTAKAPRRPSAPPAGGD